MLMIILNMHWEICTELEPIYQGAATLESGAGNNTPIENTGGNIKDTDQGRKWMSAGAFDHAPEHEAQILQFVHKDFTYFTGTRSF